MAASEEFEVVVYGSTSGAVATAIQAARLGRTTALVSPREHIGGIQINGLGGTDIDNQVEFQNSTTLGGLNLEFHRRISTHYGRLEQLEKVVSGKLKDPDIWRFESRVAEKIIVDWLAELPGIEIIKSALVEEAGVTKDGTVVKAIQLENGQAVAGKVFVDASYEGDLLAAAGISTSHGRESSSKYNESLAGVRDVTPYRQIDVDVDHYVRPGDPSSGLLYGISPEPFGAPGDGDLHLQSFSYRLPITDEPANRVPFTQPEGYDPAHYELHRRFLRAGGAHYTPRKRLPNGKTDLIGSEGALSTDLLGMNDEWPVASYAGRRKIIEETARFTKGLLWFWANDKAVPVSLWNKFRQDGWSGTWVAEAYRKEWARFGYCRDEFQDNDHFPWELYVRDARRMLSDYIITESTASQGGDPQVDDPVAVAFWPTDTHSVRRILRDGKVHNEGFIFKDGHRWRPFGVAYRALVPRRSEATNIITPTCPSSSHVGYGAVRLEHQFHALGQACANACDIALANGLSFQDVPYGSLRDRLLQQGVVLDADTVGLPSFGDE